MKIKPEDLAVLKAHITPYDTTEWRACAQKLGYSDQRYRWDLLWACRLKIGDGVGIKGDLDLYSYMDDSHLDTALKSIVRPLKED